MAAFTTKEIEIIMLRDITSYIHTYRVLNDVAIQKDLLPFSKSPLSFYQTIRRCITEDRNLHSHKSENHK